MAEALLRPAASAPRVFLCIEPVDFRKSIDGLSLIVEQGKGDEKNRKIISLSEMAEILIGYG